MRDYEASAALSSARTNRMAQWRSASPVHAGRATQAPVEPRDLLDAENTLHAHLQAGEELGWQQQVSYQSQELRKSTIKTSA